MLNGARKNLSNLVLNFVAYLRDMILEKSNAEGYVKIILIRSSIDQKCDKQSERDFWQQPEKI
jgi:hypothetical protein